MSSVSKHAKLETNGNVDDELVKSIDSCQNEIDAINNKCSEEILQVDKKYNNLRQPFLEKRAVIIKRIPNFWATSIINHPKISRILDEEEMDCLHSLRVLEVEEFELEVGNLGYRIDFYFDENPYFENKVLSKEFHLRSLSKSTPIKWKEGKNLLKNMLVNFYRNTKKRNSDYRSFFDWFSADTGIVDDKIALVIRDEIWQNPQDYYLKRDVMADPEDDGEDEGN